MNADDPLAPPPGYVHGPEDKPLDDTRCDVREEPTFLLPHQQRCPNDGILRVWFGCPREHMGFADVCSRHKFAVLAGFPAKCARCASAGEPSRSVIIKQEELIRKVLMMFRKLLAALAVPAAAIALAIGGQAAHATVTTVTGTTHVFNAPDSGNGGTWATDDYLRTATVSVSANQSGVPAGFVRYNALVSDNGTFTTIAGAKTPNQFLPGQVIAHVVHGTFTGQASYTVLAPAADALGSTFPASLNDNHVPPTGAQSTGLWPEQAFTPQTGITVTLGNWGWTYTTTAGETWADTSLNGDGNLVADGNVTGLTARVPKLSHGHATATSPVHETVYFWQSGAASCDYFTIVGPGGINGHHGWVPGHLGWNAGYYTGLLPNHGYTVFYTPVSGPADCSGHGTSLWPHAHGGYVFFVS